MQKGEAGDVVVVEDLTAWLAVRNKVNDCLSGVKFEGNVDVGVHGNPSTRRSLFMSVLIVRTIGKAVEAHIAI